MLNYKKSYLDKVSRQRAQRRQKIKASMAILGKFDQSEESSDDDLTINNHLKNNLSDQEESTLVLSDEEALIVHGNRQVKAYQPNHYDNILNEDHTQLASDTSVSLYNNCPLSTEATAIAIMSFVVEYNASKNMTQDLIKLIKSVLPIPNYLPTTYNGILKLVDNIPNSSSEYYCNSCRGLCSQRSSRKFCENENCLLKHKPLRNREISEIIMLDFKSQLKSIISRNQTMFNNHDLFSSFDIQSGSHYKTTLNLVDKLSISYSEKIYPITLNIHTDGAPLVRTTKSSIWPCMASLVELPPQIREMK